MIANCVIASRVPSSEPYRRKAAANIPRWPSVLAGLRRSFARRRFSRVQLSLAALRAAPDAARPQVRDRNGARQEIDGEAGVGNPPKPRRSALAQRTAEGDDGQRQGFDDQEPVVRVVVVVRCRNRVPSDEKKSSAAAGAAQSWRNRRFPLRQRFLASVAREPQSSEGDDSTSEAGKNIRYSGVIEIGPFQVNRFAVWE